MILIVGLGNPEQRYFNTYHNLGFLTADKIAEKLGAKFAKKDCHASIAEAFVDGEKVVIAKPDTYMNRSGESVLAFKTKYKLSDNQIIVLVDDLDLPKGTYRYRESGSAGTHNGLRSIVEHIGTNFRRVRIGIKPEIKPFDIADYVLANFSDREKELFGEMTDEVADFVIGKVKDAG